MAIASKVKPTHKAVKSYYAALAMYADQSVEHEGALRSAFQNLLSETGRKVGWTLIPELSLNANGHPIRPDGTFRDEFTIERGYWEAKDTDDDLEAEIKRKARDRDLKMSQAPFTRIVPINFMVAGQLKANLEKFLSVDRDDKQIGSILVDEHSNSLIIQALKDDMNNISAVIKRLDRPTPQVLIEA